MSDLIPAWIDIGGILGIGHLAELVVLAQAEDIPLEYTDIIPETIMDLIEVMSETGFLSFYDIDALNGGFPALIKYLDEQNIPYNQHSESRYDHDGKLVIHRPHKKSMVFLSTQQGNPVILHSTVRVLIERIREMSTVPEEVQFAEAVIQMIEEVAPEIPGLPSVGVSCTAEPYE